MVSLLVIVVLAVIALLGVAWFILLRRSPQSIDTAFRIPKQDKIDYDAKIRADVVDDGAKFDVIVVGCGIGGSALAKALGDDGRKVLVIERDLNEPDRIVGELLQPGGIAKLKELGMEECIDNIDAQPSFGYAVFEGNWNKVLKFPHTASGNQPNGVSFHHGRFIQKLRAAARNCPNVTIVEGTVSQLKFAEDGDTVVGVVYKEKDVAKTAMADLTFVADGCNSNLRRHLSASEAAAKPEHSSRFYGLILKTPLPQPSHGHVFVMKPSPSLCYSIGTNEARALIDIPNTEGVSSPADAVTWMRKNTMPQLPMELQKPFADALDAGNVRSMPNNILHPYPPKHDQVIVFGDAWNMRHPLTGSGMTVAFSDVVCLRNILRKHTKLSNRDSFREIRAEFVKSRKQAACALNTLAFGLYNVFRGEEEMESMKHGCMEYFQMGGNCVDAPMALLGGLESSPYVLFAHYTAVACVGIYKALFPYPSPSKLVRATKMMSKALGVFFSQIDEWVYRF